MNRSQKILTPVLALILVAGCNVKKNNQIPVSKPFPVKVIAVFDINNKSSYQYIGTVEESQSIPMSFLTTGTVEKVYADEGQAVQKGQILASLDVYSYKNALEIATAKEKQAQDAYNRLSEVYKNGSLPEIKMIEIETALQQAQSMASIARKNLNDCNLVSPAHGIIGKRMIEPGANVAPGVAVISLVNIDKVYIKIPVPEYEINRIKSGQKAVVKVGALNDAEFEGIIERMGVIANPFSHTYEVKIAVRNSNYAMRPGMVCHVTLENNVSSRAIQIPQQAVQNDPEGKRFVFVVDTINNKALRRDVITGSLISMGQIEIKDGLNPGEKVITEGYQKISNNSSVSYTR